MILSSEIKIKTKKENFPNLIYEFYKHSCDVHRLDLIDSEDREDIYLIETVYSSRKNYISLIEILKKNTGKYNILEQKNSIEEKIRGGLMETKSRNPVENINDYNMNILGAAELIKEKIDSGHGAEYCSVSNNAAVISCANLSEDVKQEDLLKLYTETEKDALTLSAFTGLNGVPLLLNFSSADDIIKTISRIEKSFSLIRMVTSGVEDYLIADQIADSISIPFLSKDYDEVPLYLLAVAILIVKKYELNPADTAAGFIGVNSISLRCSKLFNKTGFFKVLGHDNNDRMMMEFEKHGGLATSNENILLNSDIVFIIKNNLDEINLNRIRPGQFVILFDNYNSQNLKAIKERGAREIIKLDYNSINHIHPGVTEGILKSKKRRMNDQTLVYAAKKLSMLMNINFTMPDLFSSIHEKISAAICETR